MKASNTDRPTDEEQKTADQNAIAQVEGEIRAFVRKDVVRKDLAPWRRSAQPGAADMPRDFSIDNVKIDSGKPRDLPIDNVNSLIGRISGQSAEQIDKLITDLETLRGLLRGEAERLQRELLGYADMSQTAMTSIRTIGESVAQWKSTINLPSSEGT
jgi:hypothetical protein